MSLFVQLNVNASLGALVAGAWLNSALYAVELLQMWQYFTHTAEGGSLQYVLAFLLAVDTTCTISMPLTLALDSLRRGAERRADLPLSGQYAAVYSYCISHWGDQAYLQVSTSSGESRSRRRRARS